MSSRTLAALRDDAEQRSYHVALKLLVAAPLLVYFANFLVAHHDAKRDEALGLVVAEAKDGLRMPLREGEDELPAWKLSLHSFAAMGLLAACVLQKEMVVWMSKSARD